MALEKPDRSCALFLVSILTGLLLLMSSHSAEARDDAGKKGPPPAPVQVSDVLEKQVATLVTLIGSAEPWLEIVVAAEESGLVDNVLVEEGDLVQKGQVLCKQRTTQLKLKIEAAKANLAEARTLQTQARRELERQQRLYNIKSVSEKAYDDARFASETARNKVERLQAELRVLEDQLGNKAVRAPVSGYVTQRDCLVGQWLGEGKPVVTLVVPDPILFMVQVPERYVPWVKVGNRAVVLFDALPGQRFDGEIDALILRAEKAARTFPVRIKISNRKGDIKPGMLGRATIPAGNRHRAILVPKDALVLSSTGKAVYVVNDASAHLVPVVTGPAHGDLIEVEGDLKAGAKVVVRGNERLRPGQTVSIIGSNASQGHPPGAQQRENEP